MVEEACSPDLAILVQQKGKSAQVDRNDEIKTVENGRAYEIDDDPHLIARSTYLCVAWSGTCLLMLCPTSFSLCSFPHSTVIQYRNYATERSPLRYSDTK